MPIKKNTCLITSILAIVVSGISIILLMYLGRKGKNDIRSIVLVGIVQIVTISTILLFPAFNVRREVSSQPSPRERMRINLSVVRDGNVVPDSVRAPYPGKVGSRVFRLMLTDPFQKNGELSGRKLNNLAVKYTDLQLKGTQWKTVIIGDEQAREFWETYFPPRHAFRLAFEAIHPTFNAARADILRLALMYIHGGIYIDYKSTVTKGPLPSLPSDKDIAVYHWRTHQEQLFRGGEYANWVFMARAGSPVVWDIMVHICRNIQFLQKHGPHIVPLFYELADTNDSKAKRMTLSVTGPIASTEVLLKYPELVDTELWEGRVEFDRFRSGSKLGPNHYSNQPPNKFLSEWHSREVSV